MMRWQTQLLIVLVVLGNNLVTHSQPVWPPPYREPTPRVVEASAPPDLPWTLEQLILRVDNLKKAQINGKYRMLMLQFDAPASEERYGAFHEVGLSDGPPDASLTQGLPQLPLRGYWVYASPSWYVWHEQVKNDAATSVSRVHAVEQVLGAPDTPFTGTLLETAWAPKKPDAPEQWLLLEFEHAVQPARLQIYESLHPGAIKRITMMALDGSEFEVWSGHAPTREVKGTALFEVKLNWPSRHSFLDPNPNPPPRAIFSTHRVKIYLDCAVVEGWNEIDAVALMDFSNLPQWPTAALASSSYADADPNSAENLPAALIGGWKPVLPTFNLEAFLSVAHQ